MGSAVSQEEIAEKGGMNKASESQAELSWGTYSQGVSPASRHGGNGEEMKCGWVVAKLQNLG